MRSNSGHSRALVLVLGGGLAVGGCLSKPPPGGGRDLSFTFDLAGADLTPPPDLAGADLTPPPDGFVPLESNQVAIVVDSGPSAAMGTAFNVPFISVKLCAPGSTTNCQTIDHITVDTGSVGMHIISSVINPTLLSALPITQNGGNEVAECYSYASGYVFGSVRTADLTIGGEHAPAVAFMAIADPGLPTTPAGCSQGGQAIETVADFGSNGIIGVGLFAPDCGSACATSGGGNPIYYSCPGGTCTSTGLAVAQQLQNPVSLFATDNNGVILEMPTIPDKGAVNPTGVMTFGIGTQANNAVGSATVIPATVFPAGADSGLAVVTTLFGGSSYSTSVFDSGTVGYGFTNNSITACSGAFAGLYCPTGTQSYTAMLTDANSMSHSVSFKIANPMTDLMLETSVDTAFDDFALSGLPSTYFIWGFSYFYGHRLISAIDGKSTPAGMGPYYAF